MSIDSKLIIIAPEMKSLDIAFRAELINIAKLQVNFGTAEIKQLATAYLAAHIYTLSLRNGASGYVASEKEGDLSRNFMNTVTAGSYGSTSYGMEFQRLLNMNIIGARTRQVTR